MNIIWIIGRNWSMYSLLNKVIIGADTSLVPLELNQLVNESII